MEGVGKVIVVQRPELFLKAFEFIGDIELVRSTKVVVL